MTAALPRPAEAGAALAVFLGQAVLPPVALAVAWLGLAGVPAPFAAILAAAAASIGLSLPLLFGRGFVWFWGLLPGLVAAAILARLPSGVAAAEAIFLAALALLATGAALAARSASLKSYLEKRRPR
ncbi:hypothetical protein [Roseomonas sp. 18066]|uniref:hypothetical protein n=1 Tax=Roseomonas sp. 18066 TaxID=2681412 RepID=UPI001357A58A|nr:hypothetical protein [Roseomonas sp. 18066]